MTDILAEILKEEWCGSFAVRPLGEGRWVVDTPLAYGDGDAIPVFLEYGAEGWSITDNGMSVSHLYFDEVGEYTEARYGRIRMVVEAAGASIGEHHQITLALGGDPSPHAIGDFLQIAAQVQGVARTWASDRDAETYRVSVRSRVQSHLLTPDFQTSWFPPQLGNTLRGTYEADLYINTGPTRKPVVLFAASTNDRANVAALSVRHFLEVTDEIAPLLAVHPDKVNGEAIYRFQDEVDDDASVVRVSPGYVKPLLLPLRGKGVPTSV